MDKRHNRWYTSISSLPGENTWKQYYPTYQKERVVFVVTQKKWPNTENRATFTAKTVKIMTNQRGKSVAPVAKINPL